MKKAFSLFLLCFVLGAADSSAQNLDLYVSADGQLVKGPESAFEDDFIVYPEINLGYWVHPNHRFGLALSYISATSQSSMSGNESGTDLRLTAYPVALDYKFDFYSYSSLAAFLGASLSIVPIRDEWDTDTPPEEAYSTNFGGSVGIGVLKHFSEQVGLFSSINYRLLHSSSERPAQHIKANGVFARIGLRLSL